MKTVSIVIVFLFLDSILMQKKKQNELARNLLLGRVVILSSHALCS